MKRSSIPWIRWVRTVAVCLCATSITAILCGASSCKSLSPDANKDEEEKLPKWHVSINEIVKYPRGAEGLEKEVPSFDGRSLWVNNNHFLSSKSISKAEMVPRTDKMGYYDLKLTLDRHGQLAWLQMSMNFSYKKELGILLDGMYYRSLSFKKPLNEEKAEVILEGPFDAYVAEQIVKYAPLNFKHFHPDEK